MIEKLKTNNISFREQKQGGQVNNYYQSTQKQNFKDQGYCRRVIPEAQRADNRAAHYSLGFEKPFSQMNRTFEFRTGGQSLNQNSNTNLGGESSLQAAAKIANKQKTCNITVGGAPSYQRST